MTGEASASPWRSAATWVAVSSLLVPAGWLASYFVALMGFAPEDDPLRAARPFLGVAIVLATAGVPACAGIALLVRRKADRSISRVGSWVCIAIAVVALGTSGLIAWWCVLDAIPG